MNHLPHITRLNFHRILEIKGLQQPKEHSVKKNSRILVRTASFVAFPLTLVSHFKSAFKMFKELKETMSKEVKEWRPNK